jgi:hypothetical protein
VGTSARSQISLDQQNVIRGVVINGATREPIGHALVYSADKRFATLTDDRGHFQFAVPAAPETTPPSVNETVSIDGANFVGASFSAFPSVLLARKPGFLSTERRRSRWDIVFVEPGKEVTIALVPEARIVGRVVLPSSNAADRMVVHLYRRRVVDGLARWEVSSEVAARSNGEFRFAGLEAGTYKVFTGELMDRDPLTFNPSGPVYGYPPSYFPNAANFQAATDIRLAAGMTFQADLSPVRRPYYNVKLPINTPPGEQVLVSVAIQGRRGPGFELGYNPRDQTVEGSLPNGTYLIEVTSQSAMVASGSSTIAVKGGSVEGSAIGLVPNGSVHFEAKLELTPDIPTEGASSENRTEGPVGETTFSAPNQPGKFTVVLEPADEFTHPEMPNGPTSLSQHDNTVTFTDVPSGRYWVKVNSPFGFAASVKSGDVDLLRNPLTVHPGANLRVDVDLRNDGAEISGIVESGKAQTSASTIASRGRAFVYCIPLPDSPGQFREIQTGPDGSFELNQLPPGSYRVLVFDHPQTELEFRNSDAMRAFENKGQIVRLNAGQKEHLTLQVIPSNE